MVKVKIFGILRTTIGFGMLEIEAKTVQDIFTEISKIMEKNYIAEQERLEALKDDPKAKFIKPKSPALLPHKELNFGDAIVFVEGERCMRKRMKLSGNEEIWLLSPAAGG